MQSTLAPGTGCVPVSSVHAKRADVTARFKFAFAADLQAGLLAIQRVKRSSTRAGFALACFADKLNWTADVFQRSTTTNIV